jgi:GST-like protein
MFQMGGVGPMIGQLGFFHIFAGKDWEDKRPRDRYAAETRRLLGVMDKRLEGRDWFVGDAFSIVDISLLGWVRNIVGLYNARGLVEFDSRPNVVSWLERSLARPAVQRGLNMPPRS